MVIPKGPAELLRLVFKVPLVLLQGIDHLPPLEHSDQLMVVINITVLLSNVRVNGTLLAKLRLKV